LDELGERALDRRGRLLPQAKGRRRRSGRATGLVQRSHAADATA
jgi:hypothetical protein